MLKIETNDGAHFQGRNAKAIVRAMKHDQWSAPDTKGEYMEQVSDTVMGMYGAVVRIDSAENFLHDLGTAKLVRVLDY